jgi:hypothetical protein
MWGVSVSFWSFKFPNKGTTEGYNYIVLNLLGSWAYKLNNAYRCHLYDVLPQGLGILMQSLDWPYRIWFVIVSWFEKFYGYYLQ